MRVLVVALGLVACSNGGTLQCMNTPAVSAGQTRVINGSVDLQVTAGDLACSLNASTCTGGGIECGGQDASGSVQVWLCAPSAITDPVGTMARPPNGFARAALISVTAGGRSNVWATMPDLSLWGGDMAFTVESRSATETVVRADGAFCSNTVAGPWSYGAIRGVRLHIPN